MPIPLEIQTLVERVNQELDETEQEATEGINLVRQLLSRFSDNAILIQYFGYFNTALLFVETSKRQVQTTVETILPDNVTAQVIQDAGKNLAYLFGRILENKIRGRRIINSLKELLL